jgi:hypothetical protein
MPLQVELYKKFVETGISELGISDGKMSQSALSIITSLKKLCNRKFYFIFNYRIIGLVICFLDPALIFEKCLDKVDGFAKLLPLFPAGFNIKTVDPVISGKRKSS